MPDSLAEKIWYNYVVYSQTAKSTFVLGTVWVDSLVFTLHSDEQLTAEQALAEAKSRLSGEPGFNRVTRIVEEITIAKKIWSLTTEAT
jgi:hypothetical protein